MASPANLEFQSVNGSVPRLHRWRANKAEQLSRPLDVVLLLAGRIMEIPQPFEIIGQSKQSASNQQRETPNGCRSTWIYEISLTPAQRY
jgi:hypothetical protein